MKQIFMTLALLLMAATEAWADETNIGSIAYNTTLGAYEIKNANNLNDLAVYVNGTGSYSTGGKETTAHDCTGLTFRLTDDVTYNSKGLASGESNFTAIDNYSHSFNGHFDGTGHTISGIRISQGGSDYQGVFGATGKGAVVERFTLNDADIAGKAYTGGVVGFNRGTGYTSRRHRQCHHKSYAELCQLPRRHRGTESRQLGLRPRHAEPLHQFCHAHH